VSPEASNKLAAFERDLRTLMGEQADLRPFVCNGSPLECGVFVVGFNPATEMTGSFWDHWRPGWGFCKEDWLVAYKEDRRNRVQRAGKRYLELSPTRRGTERILKAFAPIPCLETNIYSTATPRARDLKRGQKDMEIFKFLLNAVKPRVVIAHGRKAAAAAKALGISESAHLICAKHFSRGLSEETLGLVRKTRDEWKPDIPSS
jgi:hypothetical protein